MKNISLGKLLFLIFLVLKLTGNIDWSWWWVTSPVWITLILLAILVPVTVWAAKKDHDQKKQAQSKLIEMIANGEIASSRLERWAAKQQLKNRGK